MKILIPTFICIPVLAVYSIGLNSSLFESKLSGVELTDHFLMPYLVTILYRNVVHRTISVSAMGSVYNKYCIITSLDKAKYIDMEKDKYFVELSPRFESHQYDIEQVFYTKESETQDTVVSTSYGLLKVGGTMSIDREEPIHLINMEDRDIITENFMTGGWTVATGSYSIQVIAIINILDVKTCKLLSKKLPNVNSHHGLVCAKSEQIFAEHDFGAPVYLVDDHLLGVIITTMCDDKYGQIIFITLLYHEQAEFHEFAMIPPVSAPLNIPLMELAPIKTRPYGLHGFTESSPLDELMSSMGDMSIGNSMQSCGENYHVPSSARSSGSTSLRYDNSYQFPTYTGLGSSSSQKKNLDQRDRSILSSSGHRRSTSFRSSLSNPPLPEEPQTSGGNRKRLSRNNDFTRSSNSISRMWQKLKPKKNQKPFLD